MTVAYSLRKYWSQIGGGRISFNQIRQAFGDVAKMKNLAGGHGEGCQFEDQDTYSNKRRWLHHFTMYGFLLCFASTSSATLMHYLFEMPAPYGFWSLPKLFGVTGGLMLCVGTAGLASEKLSSNKDLAAENTWGGDMAFVILLFLVSATGLALYWIQIQSLLPWLLAIHLGCVLTFFLTLPYTKMVHGFYRLAALIRNAQN